MELAMVDDVIVPIDEAMVSAHDRCVYFGDGVYEVVVLCNGRLFAMERHMARLERSLRESEKKLRALSLLEGELEWLETEKKHAEKRLGSKEAGSKPAQLEKLERRAEETRSKLVSAESELESTMILAMGIARTFLPFLLYFHFFPTDMPRMWRSMFWFMSASAWDLTSWWAWRVCSTWAISPFTASVPTPTRS